MLFKNIKTMHFNPLFRLIKQSILCVTNCNSEIIQNILYMLQHIDLP